MSYEVASGVSTDAGDKRLTICRCKLKEDPAPAGGAATDVPASELVRFDRFRDGGWVKKIEARMQGRLSASAASHLRNAVRA